LSIVTAKFFEWDFAATLFPMKTNRLPVTKHKTALEAYVSLILKNTSGATRDFFLPQSRVYAAKANRHLRRTVLDPVAT